MINGPYGKPGKAGAGKGNAGSYGKAGKGNSGGDAGHYERATSALFFFHWYQNAWQLLAEYEGIAGNGTDGKGTDGKGIAGNGTDGKGTDGKGIDGKGKGKGTAGRTGLAEYVDEQQSHRVTEAIHSLNIESALMTREICHANAELSAMAAAIFRRERLGEALLPESDSEFSSTSVPEICPFSP